MGPGVCVGTLGVQAALGTRTESRVGTHVRMNVPLGVWECVLLSGGVFCLCTSTLGRCQVFSGPLWGQQLLRWLPTKPPHPKPGD